MWNSCIKAEYLASKIVQSIEAYALQGTDLVLCDVIDEIRKLFPSCSEEEINDILSLCFEMYNMKQKETIDLVITAPKKFSIKIKQTKDVFEQLIKDAGKSIIMTGYSVSDYFTGMLDSIISKSQQGVYVRFYVNDIEKNKAALDRMLAYRSKYLQFYEYEKNKDDKMAASHAKILIVDSKKVLVSSANLSYHGLTGNIEMGFLVNSVAKSKQIEELFKELVRMHIYNRLNPTA
ncbi:phospholipase D-like domain-containing protein [Anaerovibrio sp. RM50]|uniref:phospholipase D-like domain-containing protein n=1 Tax=Anaerovibrio sp. RM50 TaxID=1200557 RepID=UPI0004814FA1|nr:phospholipase D-like domain-containing protein [Anaerovibrio sp. RM50]